MSKAQKEKGLFARIWNNTIFNHFVFWFFLILLAFSCGILGYKIGFDKARETRITPLGELKPIEDFSINLSNYPRQLPEAMIIIAELSIVQSNVGVYDEVVLYYSYGVMYFSSNVHEVTYFNILVGSNLLIFYQNSYITLLETTDFDWFSVNGTLKLPNIFLFERVN